MVFFIYILILQNIGEFSIQDIDFVSNFYKIWTLDIYSRLHNKLQHLM